MPIYDANHLEYNISSGHIHIVLDDGSQLPAYWAHPTAGARHPAVVLIHDWWGVTPIIRRIVHLFAQTGYYAIVPDLFDGRLAKTPVEAMQCIQTLGDGGFERVDAALKVLAKHHQTTREVAVIGVGMGGSLTFEAAIKRTDLKAAIAIYGFPQRYLGQFSAVQTPLLAIYGRREQHIKPPVIERLRAELQQSPLAAQHEVLLIEGLGHDFIADGLTDDQRQLGRRAWNRTLAFLEQHLKQPKPAAKKRVI